MQGDSLDSDRLALLIEAGRDLVSQVELDALLDHILTTARELIGARYAALGILDEHRSELERFLTSGIDERKRAEIGELPRGRGVLGLLIDDPRPLRIDDIGAHPSSYGFPPGHPPMRGFLGVPILIDGEAFGNLYLTEKLDGTFDETDEESAVILAEWAGIAIDNARRFGGERLQRNELLSAVRSLEATAEVARAVGGETDLQRIVTTIAKRARALVEARGLMLLMFEGDELVVAAAAGDLEQDPTGRRLRLEGVGPEDLRARSEEADARLTRLPGLLGESTGAALVVPLVFRGRPLGLIVAVDRLISGPQFLREDERLMRSFAGSAAIAVATAKSAAEERLHDSIAASERERGRWARELHDETLQGLGALRLQLAAALRSGSAEALAGTVRESLGQIDSEIDKLRGLISELRPAALSELGLAAAVSDLAEHRAAAEGLAIDCSVALDDRGRHLGVELESTIYRIVQEGLTNAAKHSRAENVRISIRQGKAAVRVSIEDDGVGFDVEDPSEGLGLLGMRERAEMMGGELSITAAQGSGTEIEAVLPLAKPG